MSDDLIKRSDAIAEIYKVRTPDVASHQYAEVFVNAVCRAPTIDRPQGEWKRVSADKYVQHAYHFYRCSKCGYDHIGKTNYCPNCGSKMRGEHDD